MSMNMSDFLEIVKAHPELYDRNHFLFKDLSAKEAAWAKVSALVGKPVINCKRSYNTWRTKYSKHLKELREQSSAPELEVAEKFKPLDWLTPFITHRTPRRGIVDVPNITKDRNFEVDMFQDCHGLDEVSNSQWSPTADTVQQQPCELSRQVNGSLPTGDEQQNPLSNNPLRESTEVQSYRNGISSAGKRRRLDSDLLGSGDPPQQMSAVDKQTMLKVLADQQADDEDRLFCLSLVPKLRRLTGMKKCEAQSCILKVLAKAEFGVDDSEGTS